MLLPKQYLLENTGVKQKFNYEIILKKFIKRMTQMFHIYVKNHLK
jgi:hypothetical protein